MPKNNSVVRKLIACFISGLTAGCLLLFLGNSNIKWLPPQMVFSLVAILLLVSFIYPFIWHHKERKGKTDSNRIYGIINSIIICTISANLAGFGWKKLLGLQFAVPDSIASQPMNQMSGEWLTWFYFGYSHAFVIVLALIQIAGAIFMLFRKTVLVAAIGVFAFMLNLSLINIFYNMNMGALTQSLLITIGLVYIILCDYERLKTFFFKTRPRINFTPITNQLGKKLLRLLVVLVPLLYILYLKYIL